MNDRPTWNIILLCCVSVLCNSIVYFTDPPLAAQIMLFAMDFDVIFF